MNFFFVRIRYSKRIHIMFVWGVMNQCFGRQRVYSVHMLATHKVLYFLQECLIEILSLGKSRFSMLFCQWGVTKNPTYGDICTGETNHAEVVRVVYRPEEVSFLSLLEIFWTNHNPCTENRQRYDTGTQYRSGIYTTTELQLNVLFFDTCEHLIMWILSKQWSRRKNIRRLWEMTNKLWQRLSHWKCFTTQSLIISSTT